MVIDCGTVNILAHRLIIFENYIILKRYENWGNDLS